jgi:hypothetical protein
MDAPRWARNLLKRIAADYAVHEPALHWRNRRRPDWSSAGSCALDCTTVTVTAGTDKMDSRITLVHEMAHQILLCTKSWYRGEHSAPFYAFLWTLFRRYRVSMRAALESEAEHHRKTVLSTYRNAGGRLKVV